MKANAPGQNPAPNAPGQNTPPNATIGNPVDNTTYILHRSGMYYAVLHGTIRGRFRTQVEAEDCLTNYGAAYWFVR